MICLKLKQLLPAYFLKLIFDKIQVIWMFQSATIAAKLPFENFFMFFRIQDFFYLLMRKSLLCFRRTPPKLHC